MKTFKDLQFKKHSNPFGFNTQASMQFDNKYGVSVITGSSAYSSNSEPYEVAVTYEGVLCYSSPITNDVLGYNTSDKVTNIMKRVQELK